MSAALMPTGFATLLPFTAAPRQERRATTCPQIILHAILRDAEGKPLAFPTESAALAVLRDMEVARAEC